MNKAIIMTQLVSGDTFTSMYKDSYLKEDIFTTALEALVKVLIAGANSVFYRGDHVPDHIFRSVMQEGCKLPLGLGGGHDPSKERLDE